MRHLILLLLMLCGTGAHASGQTELLGLDGSSHALSAYIGRGQWVMVNVWGPGCTHCVAELPTLREFHSNNEFGAMVLGVTVAYPGFGYPEGEQVRTFANENKINFPLLLADRKLASDFVGSYVDVVPITLAFNPTGQMVAKWHGVITLLDINEIIRDFSVQTNE